MINTGAKQHLKTILSTYNISHVLFPQLSQLNKCFPFIQYYILRQTNFENVRLSTSGIFSLMAVMTISQHLFTILAFISCYRILC